MSLDNYYRILYFVVFIIGCWCAGASTPNFADATYRFSVLILLYFSALRLLEIPK